MKEEDDELKKREDGSADPKAEGASNGTQQAGETLKKLFLKCKVLLHSIMFTVACWTVWMKSKEG